MLCFMVWAKPAVCEPGFRASLLVCSFTSVPVPGWAKPGSWISLGLIMTPVHRVHPCAPVWMLPSDRSPVLLIHPAAWLPLLVGWSSLARSEPITPAASGTGDVISLTAKRQHQLSLWDFMVTFHLAAVSMPHCCCSHLRVLHTHTCASSLCLSHCCTSVKAASLSAAWTRIHCYQRGVGREEEGSNKPTASISI